MHVCQNVIVFYLSELFCFLPFSQGRILEMDFHKFNLITSVLKSEMIPLFKYSFTILEPSSWGVCVCVCVCVNRAKI